MPTSVHSTGYMTCFIIEVPDQAPWRGLWGRHSSTAHPPHSQIKDYVVKDFGVVWYLNLYQPVRTARTSVIKYAEIESNLSTLFWISANINGCSGLCSRNAIFIHAHWWTSDSLPENVVLNSNTNSHIVLYSDDTILLFKESGPASTKASFNCNSSLLIIEWFSINKLHLNLKPNLLASFLGVFI